MKHVYLVRHGQTHANVNHVFQGADSELTDAGKLQAIRLAERLKNLKFDKIIVSDYKRTQQTSEPISEVSGLPVELSPLFREEKRPTSWLGKSELTAEGQQFYVDLIEKAGDKNWRIEDAENPHDVLVRIEKALKLLEDDSSEDILVVSHGDFLKQFIAYVLLGCNADLDDIARLRYSLKTTNTGISMIYHDEKRWRVLSWNDHAHFAE